MVLKTEQYEQEFAKYIGGFDANGNEVKIGRTQEQANANMKRHVFWAKNKDKAHAHGDFILGDRVQEFIRAKRYELEYVGEVIDLKYNPKWRKKVLEQNKDLVKGRQIRNERLGIYLADEDYEDMLIEMNEAADKMFDKLDEKKPKRKVKK